MPFQKNLVAILNITPDSFSDGGQYPNISSVLIKAKNLINSGASVIDIGAESTRPGATPLSHDEEWERLEILPDIIKMAKDKNVLVSLDTRHGKSAEKAIDMGVDWINDVDGLKASQMIDAVKNSKVSLVMMHSLDVPADRNNTLPENCDPVKEVIKWAESQISHLEKEGITNDRIIFDPGIGFGKTTKQSWELINRIEEFKSLGVKILVGHSRKSFLEGKPEDRDTKTVEVSLELDSKGIDYLRVHNIERHLCI